VAVQQAVRAGAHRASAPARPAARKWRRALTGWSFAAPFTVLFVVFSALPVVASLVMSVTDLRSTDLRNPLNVNFVGLDNFTKLFHDDIFMRALRNNLELAIVVPFVTIVLALAIATLVTVGGASRGTVRGIRGSGFYRVVSFFPYTVPAIVIGLIWA